MPLQNSDYEAIMREYSRRQAMNYRLLEERRQKAYNIFPRLKEIEDEMASLSAQKIHQLLNGSDDKSLDLAGALSSLKAEKSALLKAAGLPENYLSHPYTCPLCRDTGYIDGQKCSCFQKAVADLLYARSGFSEGEITETLDTFSLEYYSDTAVVPSAGMTERALARNALQSARAFVSAFPETGANLLFYGETGTGKTFLSRAIAGEALKRGHSVLYYSAHELFDKAARHRFGKDASPYTSSEREDFSFQEEAFFDCSLLIIDDLGTEVTNAFVSSFLFLCINERLLRHKSTIISTNLTLQELSSVYSERIFSRLISHYEARRLTCRDIRLQKRVR